MKNTENFEKWYDDNCRLYTSCGITLKSLIEKILVKNKIPYHSIEYRIKTKDSFIDKCKKDKYKDPISEITDVCGLRIIGYTNHDVKEIQAIIESEFEIDKDNSIDKSKIMKDDQVGYRSVHYVATFKQNRSKLTEYQEYKSIKFEIQIRTLLQHAWAEIEHDRNYKFSGELPSEIKRRFYLVSGSLELLDREFEQISKDIDVYAKSIRDNTEKGILNESINSTSLIEYLSIKFKDYNIEQKDFNGSDKEIVLELGCFGVHTLEELDNLLSDDKVEKNISKFKCFNYLGILRLAMMIKDPKRYFNEAWQQDWNGINSKEFEKIAAISPDIRKCLPFPIY